MATTELCGGLRMAIADGFKSDNEGGGISWLLFSPPLSQDEILDYKEVMGAGSYSGPGASFSRPPCFRHSASYTLITQECGLDI
jgi:hypothetical protein